MENIGAPEMRGYANLAVEVLNQVPTESEVVGGTYFLISKGIKGAANNEPIPSSASDVLLVISPLPRWTYRLTMVTDLKIQGNFRSN